MTPSKFSILLGFSLLLGLPSTTAVADDEIARDADLAGLASSQKKLEEAFDLRIRTKVDALIENRVGRFLADRTTQLLNRQSHLAHRAGSPDSRPPAAMRVVTESGTTNTVQSASNTTCKMVGHTLECVLRDFASR